MLRYVACSVLALMLMTPWARGETPAERIYSLLSGFRRLDVVQNEGTAVALAEVLIRGRVGDAALERNRPLSVRTEGEFWVVEGKNPHLTGLRISRVDARVDRFVVASDPDHSPFGQLKPPDKNECHTACHDGPEKK